MIAAGLQPGMLVVSAGVHVLSPGQKVTIYQDKGLRRRELRSRRRRPLRPLPAAK